jgi:hypothetical protein
LTTRTRIRTFATVLCATGSAATTALAEPDGMRAVRDESSVTHGQAEFGVGLLTLPGAEVCTRPESCSRGDNNVALSGWPILRRGSFAIGAGAMIGINTSADVPANDPPDVPREHARRYLSIEFVARYYLPLGERVDGWVGLTTGLGVVNDIYQTKKGLSDFARVGPRAAVLLTEGFTLGFGAGAGYKFSDNWIVGGGARLSNWFLPTTPLKSPLGDEASLKGHVLAVDMTFTVAFRSRLVF